MIAGNDQESWVVTGKEDMLSTSRSGLCGESKCDRVWPSVPILRPLHTPIHAAGKACTIVELYICTSLQLLYYLEGTQFIAHSILQKGMYNVQYYTVHLCSTLLNCPTHPTCFAHLISIFVSWQMPKW